MTFTNLRRFISLAFTLVLATSWMMVDVSALDAPSNNAATTDLAGQPAEGGNRRLLRGADAEDGLRALQTTPIWGCDGNGGACQCGKDGNGQLITMNRFWGDSNDEQVMGCGGAFALTGADLSGQWGGTQDSIAVGFGLNFGQQASYYGWEGCCYVCGANLQLAGKLSSGWYCEKGGLSGIWLKGVN